jgi:hypothetical protein
VGLLASLGVGLEAVSFEQCNTQRKLGGWCSWTNWSLSSVWKGLLETVCPSRQGEDVIFSRWFVFWNSQKHSANLVGRALGIFGLWLGARVV